LQGAGYPLGAVPLPPTAQATSIHPVNSAII
jgi:hypothetical protein